jgi:hypothetical protein
MFAGRGFFESEEMIQIMNREITEETTDEKRRREEEITNLRKIQFS